MKVAAFVLVILSGAVLGKREADSSHERYVSSTRQSRGQRPTSPPQQSLTHESGQSVRFASESPQAVNYAGSPHLLYYNRESNSAANPSSAQEQLQGYDPQSISVSYEGKESSPSKSSSPQAASYSSASDVSQFRYSSPLVKYSNLGVISQVTGEEALKSLQNSAEKTQQARYPSHYITQSQGYRQIPQETQETPENYASPQSQHHLQSSAQQQLQSEEPTSYDALLSQYYSQQQQHQLQQQQQQQQIQQQQQHLQQPQKQAVPQQLQLSPQQLQQLYQQQYPSEAASPQQQISKAPGIQAIPAHLYQQANYQGAHVRSQVPSGGLSSRGRISSPTKPTGFAEQIVNFLGQFTQGSRQNSGPQKFNNDIAPSQKLSPSDLAKQQYLLQQSRSGIFAQKQAYPQQHEGGRTVYQSVPAGYSAGQQQLLHYARLSQQAGAQSPELQQSFAVGPQGAYLVSPQGHANSNLVYSASQGAASPSSGYSDKQKAAAAQVIYSNAAPQADFSSVHSQNIYVPSHKSSGSAVVRSQLQSTAGSHSAFA